MPGFDRRTLLRNGGLLAGSAALGTGAGWGASRAAAVPDEVLNPVEVSGAEAIPVVGRLPGAQRMYMLPDGKGEFHRLGGQTMTRVARPQETGGVYELATFAGATGAAMPTHAHLGSHAALVVMGGEVELVLAGKAWRMMRGDFANIPAGVAHGWTMRSDKGRLALFTMGDRVGAAFTAMGVSAAGPAAPGGSDPIADAALARAAMAGDFQLRPGSGAAGDAERVSNLRLPAGAGPYVLLDGGGERFGGNTFCARNDNTGGQFLFIMTEGGNDGPGVGAHFHARHTEDFFGLDGETAAWAYGQAVPLRAGDFIQAPPRHLHGFRMMQPYNRFVGFLTPGIFEPFFTRGPSQNGVGGRGGGEGSRTPRGSGADVPGGPPAVRPGGDMFRALSNAGRGPDGYPLDVHGATLPLPPQDPLWTRTAAFDAQEQRLQLLAHAGMICGGGPIGSVALSPQMKRVLALKPRAEDFV